MPDNKASGSDEVGLQAPVSEMTSPTVQSGHTLEGNAVELEYDSGLVDMEGEGQRNGIDRCHPLHQPVHSSRH